MFKKYYPTYFVESVFDIDYEKLFSKGITCLIFDIDNTLVPHGEDSNEKIDALFERLNSKGFKTLLLSNNSEERIKRFIKNIDTLYVHDAEKPKIDGFRKALDLLNSSKSSTIMIGDTVFTDIAGASDIGIDSILVRYIGFGNGEKIGIKRTAEAFILKFYFKSKYFKEISAKGNKNDSKQKTFL